MCICERLCRKNSATWVGPFCGKLAEMLVAQVWRRFCSWGRVRARGLESPRLLIVSLRWQPVWYLEIATEWASSSHPTVLWPSKQAAQYHFHNRKPKSRHLQSLCFLNIKVMCQGQRHLIGKLTGGVGGLPLCCLSRTLWQMQGLMGPWLLTHPACTALSQAQVEPRRRRKLSQTH